MAEGNLAVAEAVSPPDDTLAVQMSPEQQKGQALGMLAALGIESGPDAEGQVDLEVLKDALKRQDGSVHPGMVEQVVGDGTPALDAFDTPCTVAQDVCIMPHHIAESTAPFTSLLQQSPTATTLSSTHVLTRSLV